MTQPPKQSRTSWVICAVCISAYELIAYGVLFFRDHLIEKRISTENHDLMTTPMNGYVSFWNQQFLNDFHNSVLHVIKLRTDKA